MPKKLTQRELAELRAEYLLKREELLIGKVDRLGVKLFDQVFNSYLTALDQAGGVLVKNDKNISLIRGLDSIFNNFKLTENIPVIQGWVSDMSHIPVLNERYFANIAEKGLNTTTEIAKAVTNKTLGLSREGAILTDGFTDKFISDQALLKKIKSQTLKAINQGKGFADFRNELKTTIQGVPEKELSGGLQQYYRNYAYDTYQKVDRINQDVFAKELKLRWFLWSGGVIKTTRPICRLCNGMIIDSIAFGKLELSDIKTTMVKLGDRMVPFNSGLSEGWKPLLDLGHNACRHSKDYVTETYVRKYPQKVLNIKLLTK